MGSLYREYNIIIIIVFITHTMLSMHLQVMEHAVIIFDDR